MPTTTAAPTAEQRAHAIARALPISSHGYAPAPVPTMATTTDTATGLTFGELPTDMSAPTTAAIRTALDAHPGQWTVAYVADRMARATTYADAVNDGRKFGSGYRAAVRKFGAEHRVYVTRTA